MLDRLLGLEVDAELIDAILGEAGRFAAEVIAPLNRVGDQQGCTRHADGSGHHADRASARPIAQYRESGWGTLALPEEHGGQGLPHVLATVVEEFLNSACHAFNMYPGLTHGAVAALMDRGSDELKARLPAQAGLGRMARDDGADRGARRAPTSA